MITSPSSALSTASWVSSSDIDHPPPKPSLSLSAAHAHAFSTPKGWEPAVDHRDSPPVDDLSPPTALAQLEKPKWAIPYRRYEAQDLPYTAWEVVGSSSNGTTPRGRPAPRRAASACSSSLRNRTLNDSTPQASQSTPRAGVPRPAFNLSTTKRTWEWANQVIPDPDYPDARSPSFGSPRPPSSQQSEYNRKKDIRMTKSTGDVEVSPKAYFDLPIQRNPIPDRLAVAEIGVFGAVGTVDSVFGPKQPECGLCRCDGLRFRYRVHGETCPLHLRSMRRGPTALNTESGQ